MRIMKKYILLLLAGLLALNACQEQDNNNTLLTISVTSWTFNADGRDTLTLEVQGKDWECVPTVDWIEAINNGDGTASVIASENPDGMQREASVIFSSGDMSETLAVEQLPAVFDGEFRVMYDWANPAMSPNGRYIAGGLLVGDSYSKTFLWDLETGDYEEYSLMDGTAAYNGANSVANDGTVIFSSAGSAGYIMIKDGQEVELAIPEGDYHSPKPCGISADGRVVVGTVLETILMNGYYQYKFIPVKWTDGVPEVLDQPARNMFGNESVNGTIPRCCSADGSVIVGSEWSNMFGAVYWVDGRMVDLGNDPEYLNIIYNSDGEPSFVEGIICYAQYNTVSYNGDYVALAYRKQGGYYPVMINTRTGELQVNDSYSYVTNGTVTDDGQFFWRSNTTGTVALTMDGAESTVQAYLQEKYGMRLSENFSISYISEDGNTVLGWMSRTTVMGIRYYPWYARFN